MQAMGAEEIALQYEQVGKMLASMMNSPEKFIPQKHIRN